MDFKQIEAFVNVVKYKSFSKAADATFFTQPTISTHISILEKELGSKLLDRKGRTVEMTPQGRKFYKYAVEMVNTRSRAVEDLMENADGVEGIIEIQTSSIPGMTFLPELLAGFRKTHAKVQFYVDLSDTQEVIDNINDRTGEIGFVGENGREPHLEYFKVFSDNSVLITPGTLDIPERISFEEAMKYPFIWRESGSATRKAFENVALQLGYDKTNFNVAALFNDLDSIIRSVEEGLGVSILSSKAIERIASDKIKTVKIKGFDDVRDFYMVNLKGAALSPAAIAFKNYVIENKERS